MVDGISKCWQNSAYLVSHILAHLLKSVQKHKLVQPVKLCVYLQLCKRLFTQCIIYSEAWLILQMLSSANPTHLIIKKQAWDCRYDAYSKCITIDVTSIFNGLLQFCKRILHFHPDSVIIRRYEKWFRILLFLRKKK